MTAFYAEAHDCPLELATEAMQHPTGDAKAKLLKSSEFLGSTPSKAVGGLEKVLLLAWVTKELQYVKSDSFVIKYWDLRYPNILVDREHNVAGYRLGAYKLLTIQNRRLGRCLC